jgi:hypothetical protein
VILSIPSPENNAKIPRVSVGSEMVGALPINGVEIPIRRIQYGGIENLPERVRYMFFQLL